ncbi:MAG: sulfotransferase family protein, partial [Xanthobacteraceae bacterium]
QLGGRLGQPADLKREIDLGRYCRAYQELMAHWRRVLPPRRIIDVRYEDLVDDLEGAARRMIARCGLPWDPRCLDFHRNERPVRTASAIQVRQPIYRSSVGRWRRYQNYLGPLFAELAPTNGADVLQMRKAS